MWLGDDRVAESEPDCDSGSEGGERLSHAITEATRTGPIYHSSQI